MTEWLPPLLAGSFVSAVVLVVGRLAGDRLAGINDSIKGLTESVSHVREKRVEDRARTEEAHRRIDEHLKREHNNGD